MTERDDYGPDDSEIEAMYMARDGRSPQDMTDEEEAAWLAEWQTHQPSEDKG